MDELEPQEYIDPDYFSYIEKVKPLITKEPVTYGQIHRALGKHARRDLTPIVLRDLASQGEIFIIRGYIDRFSTEPMETKWFGNLDGFSKRNFKTSQWVNRS
jgi:hypothetical protein